MSIFRAVIQCAVMSLCGSSVPGCLADGPDEELGDAIAMSNTNDGPDDASETSLTDDGPDDASDRPNVSDGPDFGSGAPPDADDHPEDGAPEPSAACEGRYSMSSWAVVESAFDASAFSTFLTDALMNGTLILSLITLREGADPSEGMTLGVSQLGPDGQPDANLPVGEPLRVSVSPAGEILTLTPGVVAFHVRGQISGYDVDLDARFEDARFTGRFAADCSFVGGRLDAAFSAAGLSLPARPDTDLDGDGRNDAYSLGSNVQALRVP